MEPLRLEARMTFAQEEERCLRGTMCHAVYVYISTYVIDSIRIVEAGGRGACGCVLHAYPNQSVSIYSGL